MKKTIAISLILGVMLMTVGFVVAGGMNKIPARVGASGTEINVPQQAINSPSGIFDPNSPNFSPPGKRVIATTTSIVDKFIFRLKGCEIIHELDDSTALNCPVGVIKRLKNVREDRIFQIIDLEADQQIGADLVWEQGIDGTGVNVAVLDTGIDTNHPELYDSYLGGYDYVYNDADPEDDHGHGTHVSGIITANGENTRSKGVAPGTGIYMYKVCDASGSCYESDMMAAMEAAVETDAKVMSISIGGGNFAGENCDSDPLAAKVNWVVNQGINVVVASGNNQYYVSIPACASGAIAVGATDKNGLMAYFSNFGPALDIVAPGVSIYSSIIDGYASWSGTSMSTPHVSGVIALILDANPSLTIDDVKTALYETADPINPDSVCYGIVRRGRTSFRTIVPCSSDNYGAGIVDAFGAVNYFIPPEPECSTNAECDDSVSCTIDICNEYNLCENNPDNSLCDDGLYCNGVETCDVILGCQAGVSIDCNDHEICTIDSCNENSDACENVWPSCSLESDGCCGPECNSGNDVDCPEEDLCLNCFKGVCDGRCHPGKEDPTCPDCQ